MSTLAKRACANAATAPQPIEPAPAPPTLPPPDELDIKASDEAEAWLSARTKPLRASVATEGEALGIRAPHSDKAGWASRFYRAFGSRSPHFANSLLSSTVGAVAGANPSPADVNAAIAFFDAMAPEDEAEALLLAQMYAAHQGAMRAMQHLRASAEAAQRETYGGLSNKFMRTFAAQMETFQRRRRGGDQTVRVEHVHVHAGAQAVVGNVNGKRGAQDKIPEQPHTPSLESAAMRSADTIGKALPKPGDEALQALPDARRRGGERCADRQPECTEARAAQRTGGRASRAAARGAAGDMKGAQ